MDPNTMVASGGGEDPTAQIQSKTDITVYNTAKTNFLPFAKMPKNINRPLPIVIDDNIITCFPMPAQVPLCRSFFNLLKGEMNKAGHGSWSINTVNGQKIQSELPPGECMVAFRYGAFESGEDAFKYACENQEKMMLLDYTEVELKRE